MGKGLSAFNSVDRDFVLRSLRLQSKVPHLRDLYEEYLEELQVRCLAPPDVMTEAHLTPESVDLFLVDAEGYDAMIVSSLLGVDGFSPAVVVFEAFEPSYVAAVSVLDRLNLVMEELVARRYTLYQDF